MSVRITDLCICCGACIDECPTESILDEDDNPTGEEIYYVKSDTCTECVGEYGSPACQDSCPTEDCIVWDMAVAGQPSREEVSEEDRRSGDTEAIIEG